MHHARPILPLPPVLGVDLSLTPGVLLLWVAAALTFLLLGLAARRRTLVPQGFFHNFFETLVEFIEKEVIRASVGPEGKRWAPFILTLFFFILFSNLLGMLPLPGGRHTLTANVNVTAALALVVFGVTLGINLARHGPLGFARKFLPQGLPLPVALLIAPIELISWLAKPVSLAVRLFANMMVGHTLIFLFIGMEVATAWYLKSLPFVGAVAMACFEIFVSFVQAFIFAMLAGLYIKEAIE
ncbi:MAG: F0F1 ATP synthase subunit A [Lentisphaerae bacterium]|nr:F0F1 ATP synthase subunit A [Lentisphaerota bacterium]